VVNAYAAEGAESLTAVTTLRRAFRTHDERALDERLDEGFAQLKELHKAMGALQVGARSSVARRPNVWQVLMSTAHHGPRGRRVRNGIRYWRRTTGARRQERSVWSWA
jgi:hypothetical protein